MCMIDGSSSSSSKDIVENSSEEQTRSIDRHCDGKFGCNREKLEAIIRIDRTCDGYFLSKATNHHVQTGRKGVL